MPPSVGRRQVTVAGQGPCGRSPVWNRGAQPLHFITSKRTGSKSWATGPWHSTRRESPHGISEFQICLQIAMAAQASGLDCPSSQLLRILSHVRAPIKSTRILYKLEYPWYRDKDTGLNPIGLLRSTSCWHQLQGTSTPLAAFIMKRYQLQGTRPRIHTTLCKKKSSSSTATTTTPPRLLIPPPQINI